MKHGIRHLLLVTGLAGIIPASIPNAQANERRFTYTYESSTMSAGQAELEPWSTVRFQREDFYLRFDERLEFEMGLTDRLQMALYLNYEAVNLAGDSGWMQETAFSSVSAEWKWKLWDPLADPVGFALYFEPGLGPSEAEFEAKVIVDKQYRNLLLAANLVGEYELEFASPEVEREGLVQIDAGVARFLTPAFAAGLEFRADNILEGGELESSVVFAGPVLSYASKKWWIAATAPVQLVALRGASSGLLDLEHRERAELRILVGFHL